MIIIIRHGETIWNTQKRKQGHKNSKLTTKGKRQAIKVANFLNKKKYDLRNFKIYSSPLGRVLEYKKIIQKNLKPPFDIEKKTILSNMLKEHKFGKWEGKNDIEIKKKYPKEVKLRSIDKWNYQIPGGGESYSLLYKRIDKFLSIINKKKDILIFTHDMVSRVLRGNIMKYKKHKIMNIEHKNNCIYIFNKKIFKKYVI